MWWKLVCLWIGDVSAHSNVTITIGLDKSTGKSEKITITNDKGRLSQDDIDRMVNEAERFKEEDEKAKARVDKKNELESYVFQARNSLEQEGIKENVDVIVMLDSDVVIAKDFSSFSI
mgnify:CR=1 FL=1